MDYLGKLKKLLEGGVAQLNPFDGGKTFTSVTRGPAVTPPPAQTQKPAAPTITQRIQQIPNIRLKGVEQLFGRTDANPITLGSAYRDNIQQPIIDPISRGQAALTKAQGNLAKGRPLGQDIDPRQFATDLATTGLNFATLGRGKAVLGVTGLPGKVLAGAREGAVLGGAQGAVDTFGQRGNTSDYIRNVGIGGGVGGVLGGAFGLGASAPDVGRAVARDVQAGLPALRSQTGRVALPGDLASAIQRNYTPGANTPDERAALKWLTANPKEALKRYDQRVMSEFGVRTPNVVGGDEAKFIIPDFDATKSASYHEPGSALAKVKYEQLLDDAATRDKPVMLMAGGTGAGKTFNVKKLGGRDLSDYAAVIDTNANRFGSADAKIQQALTSGRDVDVVYVYRDPVEAFQNGVIPRAQKVGRIVPVEGHLDTHLGSREVMDKLAAKYADNPNVTIRVIDNSRGPNKSAASTLEKIPQIGHNRSNIETEARRLIDEEYQAGRITADERATYLGATAEAQPGASRPNSIQDGGASQPAFREPGTPAQRVVSLLDKAKANRWRQDELQSAERSRRLGRAMGTGQNVAGQKGFYAQLGSLKGALPKREFPSLAGQLEQGDVDNLFNQIRKNPEIRGFDEINTQFALAKLFDKDAGVPNRSDIKLLRNAFGDEFADAVANNVGFLQKFREGASEVLNLPRSLMATLDLSAPFRQGLVLSARYPKQFAESFGQMFKYAASENAYKDIAEEIASRPSFKTMQRSGLALTDIDSSLIDREEQFMSNLAEKIPVAGHLVRGSSRAYTGFLNKLRADVFDHLVEEANKAGLDAAGDPSLLRSIAKFVNTSSGRGEVAGLETSVGALASIFFSPRLMMSRIQILNPVYYAKLDPFVRKQALQSTTAIGAAVLTVLGLSKLAGAEVGADPRSADFAKVKIGNTRIDIAGGFQQYIKLAAQLASGEIVSSTTGKEMSLTEEGFGKLSRQDILLRFLQGKENPTTSYITDYLKNKDFQGEPFDPVKGLVQRVTPLTAQTAVEIAKDNPSHLPLLAAGTVGFGVQNYGPKEQKSDKGGVPKPETEEKKGERIYTEAFGEGYKDAPKDLKRSSGRISEAQEKFAQGLSKPSQDVLTRYARLSEEGKKKFDREPKNEFELEAARFENSLRKGDLSDPDRYNAELKLGRMQIESRYSNDVADMYAMSKTKLGDFLSKNPTKTKLLAQVFELDTQLERAGFIDKVKFGGTTAKKGKGSLPAAVNYSSTNAKLRSLMKGTKGIQGRKIRAKKVTTRKAA